MISHGDEMPFEFGARGFDGDYGHLHCLRKPELCLVWDVIGDKTVCYPFVVAGKSFTHENFFRACKN